MSTSSLHGSLTAFKVSEVLSFLNSAHKTGMLTLTSGSREAYVFFRRGDVMYAASNQETLRLGSILMRTKKITREQSSAIDDAILHGGGRFGDVAIKEGILTEAQLDDYLKLQVAEVIYDAFVWREGTFAYFDDFDLPPNAVTISIDLPNLIMEGARRIELWEECLQLLPDSSVVFRVVSDPDSEKITLSLDEWKVLFLINGQRTLEELCTDTNEAPFHVYRVVYGLLANKLIQAVEPSPRENDETQPLSPDDTVRQDLSALNGGDETVIDTSDDTELLVSSEARLRYKDVVPQVVAELHLLTGDRAGAVFPLTDVEYFIGRLKDNDIQINDLGISGRHARIHRSPTGYTIEDLKSRNGTWVNGSNVPSAQLRDGDRIRLGATDLRYELPFADEG